MEVGLSRGVSSPNRRKCANVFRGYKLEYCHCEKHRPQQQQQHRKRKRILSVRGYYYIVVISQNRGVLTSPFLPLLFRKSDTIGTQDYTLPRDRHVFPLHPVIVHGNCLLRPFSKLCCNSGERHW